MVSFSFGAKVTEQKWKEGQTFSEYLKTRHISQDLLSSISEDDQKFLSEINKKYDFYELKDIEGKLLQALIPISKVMQIHLVKVKNSDDYSFNIIPILYETNEYFAKVDIENNPYSDTVRKVHNKKIATRLSLALKNVVNDKKLHKGDEIDFIYMQSTRMGKPYLMPDIKVIKVTTGKKEKFIYVDEDGIGYAGIGKPVPYTVKGKKKIIYSKRVPISSAKSRFGMPLRYARVTSSFSYSRLHPILHIYRPHHGTDFRGRRGTPLLAVNAGRVTFSGWMGGYGKVVKIRHGDGYESLYAHQSRRRVKVGEKVKKGQIIGYVGNTGKSTAPHLHYEVRKDKKKINPVHFFYQDLNPAEYEEILRLASIENQALGSY